MKQLTLARIAALMAAVQLSPAAMALCIPDSNGCGCGKVSPSCPVPPPPSPPPPPPPAQVSQYIGPVQGVVDTRKSIWQSPDAPDDPVPVSSTQVEFRSDVPTRAPGTLLSLTLDAGRSWASMSTGIDLALQMNGHTLRLTNTDLPVGTNALSVLGGQTRLLNGTVRADAGDVRIGSGNSGASLVLDSGAQLLMAGTNLRNVHAGTGGAGSDGLLRVTGASVLRADRVLLGSFIAAASGRLELSGPGSLVDLSQLVVGGTANGANGSALVNNGATLRTQGVSVGTRIRTTGELTVEGTGSLLALRGGAFNIGTAGDGLVTVSGGAALLGESATVISLGNGNIGHSSVLRVEGAGSSMSNLGVQVLPSGTFELRDGARWDAGTDQGVNALAIQAGTVRFRNAQVTMFSATVTALVSETRDVDNKPIFNVIKSGQWDIGGGSTVTVSDLVSIDTASQLLVHDTGTTLTFTDMVLNGFLSVHNGAEAFGGLIGLGPTGQIGGNQGRIHADVMGTDGRITPGNSPGLLQIDGNVTLSGQAALELEIAGNQAGISYDVLQVTGNLQMSGGQVVLKFLNGFAPKAGDVFDLLQVGGTLALDGTTPVQVQGLQAGWTFNLQQGDGHGLRLVSLNQGVALVPEPATWALWLLGAAVMLRQLGQRRRPR